MCPCSHRIAYRLSPEVANHLQTPPSFLTRGSRWPQAGEPVGPVAVSGTTCGWQWDPRLLVGPVTFGVARGCRWHLWLQRGVRSLVGPRPVDRPSPARPLRSAVLACSRPEHLPQRSLHCAFRSALPGCSVPRDGGSIEACDKCLHTDSPLATVSVCRGHRAAARLPAPATPPRESAFL